MLNKTPIAWPEAQRICDIPEVREALDKFAVDACEENMLPMVSMIMWHAASQGRAAGPVPIGMAAGGRPVYWQQKPLSPAMCALIESGQLEDGDADLVEPQGQALPDAADQLAQVYAAFGIGEQARTLPTLLMNIENARRRAECLWAIEREFFTKEVPVEDWLADEPGETHEECQLLWGANRADYVEQFRAALADHVASQLAIPAGPVPEGFVLVPMHLNAEMRDVLSEEDWTWEDLLVAANAVTEEQYYAIQSGDGESPAVAQPVSQQFPTKLHLSGAISVLFNQEQKKFHDEQASLVGMFDSWTSWEQHYNNALADFFWPMVGAVAQPVADDSQAGFWKWLDQAYRDGSKGDGFKFTKWNMEAAYRAGMHAVQPVADERVRAALMTAREAMARENAIIPSVHFTKAISDIDAALAAKDKP